MKHTLLILAAGIGSRYGGYKQSDSFGPNGELLLEYSIYDAIKVGFNKVIIIIKDDIRDKFKQYLIPKLKNKIELIFEVQNINDIPNSFKNKINRTKPWGTGHAIIAARNFISENFVMINADDFYSREAYRLAINTLTVENDKIHYFIIGYKIKNTVSKYGSVSRGLCKVDKDFNITNIQEVHGIHLKNNKIITSINNKEIVINPEEYVSMNMIGFEKDFPKKILPYFLEFLSKHHNDPKTEFLIPTALSKLMTDTNSKIKLIPTDAEWFGVTYKEDKIQVQEKLNHLISCGLYPKNLWK